MRIESTRRAFVGAAICTAAFATLPTPASGTCRTCGRATDVHLIDCTLPLGSLERARTRCFSCEPRAKIILVYWTSQWSHMDAKLHNIRCSECGEGLGVYHMHQREFDCRLCSKCAPEAVGCRRWVRELRPTSLSHPGILD